MRHLVVGLLLLLLAGCGSVMLLSHGKLFVNCFDVPSPEEKRAWGVKPPPRKPGHPMRKKLPPGPTCIDPSRTFLGLQFKWTF